MRGDDIRDREGTLFISSDQLYRARAEVCWIGQRIDKPVRDRVDQSSAISRLRHTVQQCQNNSSMGLQEVVRAQNARDNGRLECKGGENQRQIEPEAIHCTHEELVQSLDR